MHKQSKHHSFSYILLHALALLLPLLCCSQNPVAQVPGNNAQMALHDSLAIQTAREAYLFGYPLVMMELTRRTMTNFEKPTSQGAPMNQIFRKEEFPDEHFKTVVKPNCDTYYALAWLDLSGEPLVLEIPNTQGRYFLMPILDAWTNVIASPGKRTTGTKAQTLLITGPGWNGKVPEQMQQVKSPTCLAWLTGRTQVNSKEDGATIVKTIQDGYRLTPLSNYRKSPEAPLGKINSSLSGNPPVKQINEMPVDNFFNLLNQLMLSNPPYPADSGIIRRIASLGIGPGNHFDLSAFSSNVQDSLKTITQWSKKIFTALTTQTENINGWNIQRGLGAYGIRYEQRALIAGRGLGANLEADAIYPSSSSTATGEKYDGAKHDYVLHFDAGQLPPANAFWSLTMYNMENYLVANPINRFAIGDRDDLKFNQDGSLDIFIQHENPGKEKENNWLPAPAAPFNLTLRIYWPREAALNGTWLPAGVKAVK